MTTFGALLDVCGPVAGGFLCERVVLPVPPLPRPEFGLLEYFPPFRAYLESVPSEVVGVCVAAAADSFGVAADGGLDAARRACSSFFFFGGKRRYCLEIKGQFLSEGS